MFEMESKAYGTWIQLIRNTVEESDNQILRVNGALSTFQDGLVGIEREMLPIYQLTEKLRITQRNIDLCIEELDRVRRDFRASHELMPVLLHASKYDQQAYKAALERLLGAITFLESHKSYEGSGKALDHSKEVLFQVKKIAKSGFLSAVSVTCKADCDDITLKYRNVQPESLKAQQWLSCLELCQADRTQIQSDYAQQRLQLLRMHFSWITEGNPAPDFTSKMPEILNDVKKTILQEKSLLASIFTEETIAHSVFCTTISPILTQLKAHLDNWLRVSIKSNCFHLLLVHKIVQSSTKEFDSILQPPLLLRSHKGTGFQDPRHLSDLMHAILNDLTVSTKERLFTTQLEITDPIASPHSMPNDGNVHAASSLMLQYIRKLFDHHSALDALLSNEGSAEYVESAVMQLVEALSSAKTRADRKQIFLINNFGFIKKNLEITNIDNAGIGSRMKIEILPRLEELRKQSMMEYNRLFVHVLAQSAEEVPEKLIYLKNGSTLARESGRLLKEKFSKFNLQLEELKAHRQFTLEPSIRHSMIQNALDTVVPAYTRFYEKYSVIQFSKKHASKYLQYTPVAVETLLKELFHEYTYTTLKVSIIMSGSRLPINRKIEALVETAGCCSNKLADDPDQIPRYLLEIGCGVGNAALPLLESNTNLHIIAVDFAPTAIELFKKQSHFEETRCTLSLCDVTKDDLAPLLPSVCIGVDYALVLFCLSGIHPSKMDAVARNIFNATRPEGKLFLRDYGRYDQAQLRFKAGHKLEENFYARGDNTRAYYFTTDEIKRIFEQAGFHQVENKYIRRQYINRKQHIVRYRVWVHAVFQKPPIHSNLQ
ncbi:hypothetical protein ABG067_005771 [Albugo candida]